MIDSAAHIQRSGLPPPIKTQQLLLTQKEHSEQHKQQLFLGAISPSCMPTEEPCTVKGGQKKRLEWQSDLEFPVCAQPITKKVTIQCKGFLIAKLLASQLFS